MIPINNGFNRVVFQIFIPLLNLEKQFSCTVLVFLDKLFDRNMNIALLIKNVMLFIMNANIVPKIEIIYPPIELKNASLP